MLDTLVGNLYYDQFDAYLADNGGQDIAMLTEFMQEWRKDNGRWVDAVVKSAAEESQYNRDLIAGWIETWRGKAAEALAPLADAMLGDGALATALAALEQRAAKAGIK